VRTALERAQRARPNRLYSYDSAGETFAAIVPLYLDLVMRNLLDNADKYSPLDAPIEVSAETSGDYVVISVRDHGPGVSEELRERLFDRFYRAPGAAGVYGAGIGLAVCKRLLENQGGDISCENANGGGLIVHVRIPAIELEDEPLEEPAEPVSQQLV
jgi:signal transduction histidine kinase